jgi:hypothetical protein
LAPDIAHLSITCPHLSRNPASMSDPFLQRAQGRYARIRRASYAAAHAFVLASGRVSAPFRLAECDPHTLSVWKAMWTGPHPSGWGGWNWEPLLRRAWRNPADFHLAIWSGKVLCGLAVGRASDANRNGSRSALSVNYIEGAHDVRHPLRGSIIFLATSAAEAYGRAIGAHSLRLMQPLPHILHLYTRLGFDVVTGGNGVLYCERRIEP